MCQRVVQVMLFAQPLRPLQESILKVMAAGSADSIIGIRLWRLDATYLFNEHLIVEA